METKQQDNETLKTVAAVALKEAQRQGWFEEGNPSILGVVGARGRQLLWDVLQQCFTGAQVDIEDVVTLEDLGLRGMGLSVSLTAFLQALSDTAAANMLTTTAVETLTGLTESGTRLHVARGLMPSGILLRGRLYFSPGSVEQFLRKVYTGPLPEGDLGLLYAEKISAATIRDALGRLPAMANEIRTVLRSGAVPVLRYLRADQTVMLASDAVRMKALFGEPGPTRENMIREAMKAMVIDRVHAAARSILLANCDALIAHIV